MVDLGSGLLNAPTQLAPLGHNISRPSSTSTIGEGRTLYSDHGHNGSTVSLPGLSTLANVATTGGASLSALNNGISHNNMYSNASPTPTIPGGQPNTPPVCQNCSTSTTPLWRRDEIGSVLCNACGLFLKLHGRPRPISLKTDVIKSRNRVKSAVQGGRKRALFQNPHEPETNPATHLSHRRVSDQHISYSARSLSPVSRSGTPSMYTDHGRTLSLPHASFDPAFRSPSPLQFATNFNHSHSAPHPSTYHPVSPHLTLPPPNVNGHVTSPSIGPTRGPSYADLRTRVSELEVINDMFRDENARLEKLHKTDADTIADLRGQVAEMRKKSTTADGVGSVEGTMEMLGSRAGRNGKRSRAGTASSIGRAAKHQRELEMSNALPQALAA